MPTRLPGRRAVGRAGSLRPKEREDIEKWFIEGLTVVEVYARCLDKGIQPPIEHTLYRILNSPTVQDGLRLRRDKEIRHSVASIARRTASRDKLLAKIEGTVEARGDEYAELIPGGEHGLVVLADRKVIKTGQDTYDTYDIYKTDTGMMEQWRGVLNDQEKADAALRRNLRGEERDEQEADLREQTGEIREQERIKLELEIERLRAELETLQAEKARQAEGAYQAKAFPNVIVERLENPNRPPSVDEDEASEDDEVVTPAIPWQMAQ